MGPTQNTDAVDLMEREHEAILALFAAYDALLAGQGNVAARKSLADQICLEITIHMRLESEMLYPLASDGAGSAGRQSLAADHASVREQIAQVLGTGADQPGYDASVLALGRCVHDHVQEERVQLFPAVRVSGADLARLAARVRERRLELQTVSEALREQAMLPAYA